MPKDENLEKALKYDAVDDAELMTGKPREDFETGLVGLGNLVEGTMITKELLKKRNDTFHSMKFEDYIKLIVSIGFNKVWEMKYVADCVGEKSDELFQVYWRKGLLLVISSFTGHINSSKLYFNWRRGNDHSYLEGGYSGRCSGLDNNVFIADYDGREALRYNIRRLEETGTILEEWIEQPFLWFSHSGDQDDNGRNKRDYKEINKERMDQLPEEIQKAIKHEGEYK